MLYILHKTSNTADTAKAFYPSGPNVPLSQRHSSSFTLTEAPFRLQACVRCVSRNVSGLVVAKYVTALRRYVYMCVYKKWSNLGCVSVT